MSERRENSVLFSLRELRSIEDDRVKQEQDAERNRIESARLAAEEKVRQAQAEAERKAIDERDRLARLDQEKERQIREEKLRLEESERRAHIEAQAKIEETRIQAEIHANAAAKKAPVGAILAAVGGVLALGVGALVYVFMVVIPAREMETQRKADQAFEAQLASAIKKSNDDIDNRFDELIKSATDEKARQKLIADRERTKQENRAAMLASAKRPARKASSGTDEPKKKDFKLNCDPDKDPLCGSGIR